MPDRTKLNGPSLLPQGEVRRAVILVHGYGADGNDLIGLAPFFSESLPNTAFYSPDAPEPCEISPVGRQWFSLNDYDPAMLRRDPEEMGKVHRLLMEGVRKAGPALDDFMDGILAKHSLTPDKLALVGFSQGTMMALHVALRRKDPIAAVLGYSGALAGAETLKDELTAKPPIMLIHGDADEVIPIQAMTKAREALESQGLDVTTHPRPGFPHGIDQEGAVLGARFLAERLP